MPKEPDVAVITDIGEGIRFLSKLREEIERLPNKKVIEIEERTGMDDFSSRLRRRTSYGSRVPRWNYGKF